METIQEAINDLTSLSDLQGRILNVADRLVNDGMEIPEDLASELIEVAHEMHQRAAVLFKNYKNVKSPSHSDQG